MYYFAVQIYTNNPQNPIFWNVFAVMAKKLSNRKKIDCFLNRLKQKRHKRVETYFLVYFPTIGEKNVHLVKFTICPKPFHDLFAKHWTLANCYPFAAKDKHKKTSAKAFVMANVYSQVVMNNIEAAINECNEVYAMK